MVSQDIDLVTDQRMEENGVNSQIVFQEENLQQKQPQHHFNSGGVSQGPRVEDPERKTREVCGFVGEKMFSLDRGRYLRNNNNNEELQRDVYDKSSSDRKNRSENQNWNGEGSTGTRSCGGSEEEDEEEDEDEDDDDEIDEGDGEVEGLIVADDSHNNKYNNSGGGSVHGTSQKIRNDNLNLQKHHSSYGPSRGLLVKDGNVVCSANNMRGNSSEQQCQQQGRASHYENPIPIAVAVAVAEPEMYHYSSQFVQGTEGPTLVGGHKETPRGNGCGFINSRADVSFFMESGDSIRTILSDPVTGTLMDDAMILPCGHSFGNGGMQHVIRMKACYTCSQTVTEESVAANLSLRLAVQAFRQEEELQSCRVSKKRRDRFEQEKSMNGDAYFTDLSRGKGLQFPFVVTDRVVIKGNKRTPLRFVGREAVVTTQCLNGWYVVKTLDNAESVKLQYRSLAKVSNSPSSNAIPSKTAPSWL